MQKADERSPSDESAIRNYPQLVRRYARLLEVSSQLVSTLELQNLLKSIVAAAEELTESESASLLLYDSQTHHLYFEAATVGCTTILVRLPTGFSQCMNNL